MEIKKCILFVRASTLKQEVESQLKETREYAESLGYNEFVILGGTGKSAYKVTDEYLALIDEMKETIKKDPEIKAVVCWAMNRLFRNISVADELKNWFVENKIQLEIREPHIKLLEADGSLSNSSEMIFYFFSVYNKQQIDELKKKSIRGKNAKKAMHKYAGGKLPPFGYEIDKDKFVVPNEKEAVIVNDIFNLYATGEYSYPQLVKEINERYGTNLQVHSIFNFLKRKSYYDNTVYPPIITEAQFKACADERARCTAKPSVYKHFTFANRLIKCPKCGKGYTATERKYICHKLNKCSSPTISTANLDGLLWLIASHLESERLLNTSAKDEYLQKKAVLEAKITSVDNYTRRYEKVRQNLKKALIQGSLDADDYTDGIKKVEAEEKDTLEKVGTWKSQIAEIDKLINEDTLSIKKILEISDHITSMDEQEMRSIVRRWIKEITFEGSVWTIVTLTRTYKAVYNCYGFPTKWTTIYGHYLAARPLKRDNNGSRFADIKLKPTDLPITLAFLRGSEIV